MAENGLFPVTYERYGDLYWKRFSSYHFAADQHSCPVVGHEVLHVAAAYPVLFQQNEATIEPVALLSLDPGYETPFVSDNGQWLASYIPSALRCPPFQANRFDKNAKDNGGPQLYVNETLGLVSRSEKDEPFFINNNELTPELRNVLGFLGTRETSAENIRSICSVLQGLDLFKPIEDYEGVPIAGGFLSINGQRLSALSQAEKLVLLDIGAFELIYAHQVSLSHVTWLSQAQAQMKQGSINSAYTKNSASSRFLAAMAHAQNEELFLVGEM